MKFPRIIKSILLILTFALGIQAWSAESTMEKVETKTNEAVDSTKDSYREAKDKGCEMVNGKMECAMKKGMNKVRKVKDKIKTKATEIKNKVD